MATKRKHTELTLQIKYTALKELEKGRPNKDVAREFSVPGSTLTTWKKHKNKIYEAYEEKSFHSKRFRLRTGTYDRINVALNDWFKSMREQNVSVNGPILLEKARDFAKVFNYKDFTASNGWLRGFKKRHGITFKEVSEKSENEMNVTLEDADLPTMTVPMTVLSGAETSLSRILPRYELKDIFNAHEFGLFYAALPSEYLGFRGLRCSEGKHSKLRLTVMAASNALGEKIPMLVIGKLAEPRCFKGVENIPFQYRPHTKAWMDGTHFEEWLRDLDHYFEKQGRRIVMMIDNCSTHPEVSGLRAVNLQFMPPDTTLCTQPMNQGVIRSLKAKYRSLVVRKIIRAVEKNQELPQTSIIQAMMMLKTAWDELPEKTIVNSFRKSGISESKKSIADDNDDSVVEYNNNEAFKELDSDLSQLRDVRSDLVPDGLDAETLVDIDSKVTTNDESTYEDESLQLEMKCDTENSDLEDVLYDEQATPPSRNQVDEALEILNTLNLFTPENLEVDSLLSQISCKINQNRMGNKNNSPL